jgi:hypothetical protein
MPTYNQPCKFSSHHWFTSPKENVKEVELESKNMRKSMQKFQIDKDLGMGPLCAFVFLFWKWKSLVRPLPYLEESCIKVQKEEEGGGMSHNSNQCTEALLNQLPNVSYFEKKPNKLMGRLQNNPSIGWVHPKSTHARPLAWDNNNKIIIHSLQREYELTNYYNTYFQLTT